MNYDMHNNNNNNNSNNNNDNNLPCYRKLTLVLMKVFEINVT